MTGGGMRSTTATVLFTDLAGSTDLRASLGDDAADTLRRAHDRLLADEIAAHDGTEVKGTGDGVMAVFSSASDAVGAAVAMQQALYRFNRRAPVPLEMRVGVSSGDVVWEGADCFGTPVVEAARLCEVASPGSIVVAEVVRILVGSRGEHAFGPPEEVSLKGLGAVRACAVRWEPPPASLLPLPAALVAHDAAPFVGRDAELASLRAAWKDASTGSARVALVAGEPGMGKTRLTGELARELFADGVTVLFGRCDEGLGVPYQPFVEALRSAVTALDDDRLADVVGAAAGELVRLVPSLAGRLPGAVEPARADPETERLRLFEAIVGVLARLAGAAPVLLVVDDLHWAAKPTLLLLRHLVHGAPGVPLLVVATYRDTELDRAHPLAHALAELRREPAVDRVALRGLSGDDVAELMAARAGHALDEDGQSLAVAVHEETEGNPFFVGEVLRHLTETGAVVHRDGRWVAGRVALGIPEGVREVIGRRLSRLTEATNEVLAAGAVLGREFDAALLADVARLALDDVLDALEESERARLVASVPEYGARFTFSHALVRSTLYDEIPTTRRLRLHLRAGEAIEARTGGQSRVDELAHHFSECAALGGVEKAVAYLSRAAEDAAARTAYEEAVDYYERALHTLDPDDAAHRTPRAEILIGLGTVLRASGEHERARPLLCESAALAREMADGDVLARAALALHGLRAWSGAGDVDVELVEFLEEALRLLPDEDSGVRAGAMARLASELYFVETEADRRVAMTNEAVAMARRVGDGEWLGFVLTTAVWGLWVPGNAEQRLQLCEEVVALGRGTGRLDLEASGCGWQPYAYAELGDRVGFDAAVAVELELRERTRDASNEWVLAVHLALQASLDGRVEDFDRLAEEALEKGSRATASTAVQLYGIQRFALARMVGGIEEIVPIADAMVEQFPRIPAWRTAQMFIARELGRLDGLRPAYEWFSSQGFANLPVDANWHAAAAILAFGAHALGDTAGAAVLYDKLLPYARFGICVGVPSDVVGSTELPLAVLAETLGRVDEADRRFSAAIAFNERFGNVPWTVSSRIEHARALQRWGRAGESVEPARLALADARRCGMTRLAVQAAELTGDASV